MILYSEYDMEELRDTARAVLMLNPYAEGYSVEDLVQNMLNMAARYISDKPSYVGTLGFVLTSYIGPDGMLRIKPSIASHVVLSAAKRAAETGSASLQPRQG